MTKLFGLLGMNVSAMTLNDWIGVFFVLVSAVGMIAAYVFVFRPSNKANFDAQSAMALNDEDPVNMGEKR